MKSSDQQLDSVLEAVAGYFGALAEPTRLRVLRAVCPGERTVGSIVEETGVSQPAVSRHLAALHRHGIVTRRREASQVYYRVSDTSTAELCRIVCTRLGDKMAAQPQLRRRLEKAFG